MTIGTYYIMKLNKSNLNKYLSLIYNMKYFQKKKIVPKLCL